MKIRDYLKNDYKIYCDLDDVLVDFLKGVQDTVDPTVSTREGFKLIRKDAWKQISKLSPKWWADLEWKIDGKQLWNYIKGYDPFILTARPAIMESAIKGKKQWVKKNLGSRFVKSTIVVLGIDKQKWADKNSILIDDYKKNINQWRSKGGIGILHKNTVDTIEQLRKLGL